MIKLTDLISEVKVNKPISKEDVLNYFLEKNPYVLERICYYNKLQELLSGERYSNVEEWYESDFGDNFDKEETKIASQYIKDYYRLFKPKEILFGTFGEGDGINFENLPHYSKIEIKYEGDRMYSIYCHN